MKEAIILTPLTSPEVPAIIRDLCPLAHMNLTEGELRKSIVEKRVYKATKGQIPFGIVTLTPKPLTEMTVWLSEKESKETWIEAIKKAILQAFSAPEVYRVKWSILASCKDMLIVAEGCGFERHGEFPEEGPNREPVIAFGLSRNGSSPNESLQSSFLTEKEKLIKDGLERKILSLEAELNTAKEKIRLLETKLKKPEKTVTAPLKNNQPKLGKNERIILELVTRHPEGIKQQQIIKETGIVQSEVSKCVRSLAEKKLVTNQKTGKERLVKPVLEEIEKPEVKPESKLEIKQKVEAAIKTLQRPEISLTKGLSLKELRIEPKEAEKFAEAVENTDLCHIIGSPKDIETCFVRLKKIDFVKHQESDFGGKRESDPAITVETQKTEFTSDKGKTDTIIPKVEEKSTREAAEKILAKLSQTHREIFYAIKKAGGSLTKTTIKNEVGISKEVLESCISTLAENGLAISDLDNVSLGNIA